jgi:putative oxidoreductase
MPFCNSSKALSPAASPDSFFRLYSSHTMCWRSAQCRRLAASLVLINRYVPLALTILGPVILNILLYHLLLNHEGIVGALIVAVFWFVLFFHYRQYFSGVFTAKASSGS